MTPNVRRSRCDPRTFSSESGLLHQPRGFASKPPLVGALPSFLRKRPPSFPRFSAPPAGIQSGRAGHTGRSGRVGRVLPCTALRGWQVRASVVCRLPIFIPLHGLTRPPSFLRKPALQRATSQPMPRHSRLPSVIPAKAGIQGAPLTPPPPLSHAADARCTPRTAPSPPAQRAARSRPARQRPRPPTATRSPPPTTPRRSPPPG